MKLIIGLGNPDARYAGTRHNTGYTVLDHYAAEQGGVFRHAAKFQADIAELADSHGKAFLVKPTTYYNLSGESVRALAAFYKVPPEHILIVHDELALPFGTVRTRLGGSDAGNNGVKSISDHLSANTARLRVGIANPLRDQMDDADFVLGRFSGDEQKALQALLPKLCDTIDAFIGDNFSLTTHSP